MLKKITITTEQHREDLIELIGKVPVGHTVTIQPAEGVRSGAANRYYWFIVGLLSEYSGYSKSEMHGLLKQKHLAPILLSNDTLYQREYVRALGLQDEGKPEEAAVIMAQNDNTNLSTKKIGSKLFAEYLDQVRYEAGTSGVVIPTEREFEDKK